MDFFHFDGVGAPGPRKVSDASCAFFVQTRMRCYFVKGGRITAVELLSRTTDKGLVAQARELFVIKGVPRGAEGFEVWDQGRFIYRYPEHSPMASLLE